MAPPSEIKTLLAAKFDGREDGRQLGLRHDVLRFLAELNVQRGECRDAVSA
jgi:hypothetical protein